MIPPTLGVVDPKSVVSPTLNVVDPKSVVSSTLDGVDLFGYTNTYLEVRGPAHAGWCRSVRLHQYLPGSPWSRPRWMV